MPAVDQHRVDAIVVSTGYHYISWETIEGFLHVRGEACEVFSMVMAIFNLLCECPPHMLSGAVWASANDIGIREAIQPLEHGFRSDAGIYPKN